MELYSGCLKVGFTPFEARWFCSEEIKRMVATGEIIRDENFMPSSYVPKQTSLTPFPKPLCLEWRDTNKELPWRDTPTKTYKTNHGLKFIK